MKPPSRQEAPIVRGDGANKNGEFSRPNQKIPDCRNGRAVMHPSRPLGGGVGVRLTFGLAWPAFGRAALSAAALSAAALRDGAFS
jgi:hypothetical protein